MYSFQPIMWSDSFYAMLLLVQFTYQGSLLDLLYLLQGYTQILFIPDLLYVQWNKNCLSQLSIQNFQPMMWSSCSHAVFILVQFTYQRSRSTLSITQLYLNSSQSCGRIVPTLCSYWFNSYQRSKHTISITQLYPNLIFLQPTIFLLGATFYIVHMERDLDYKINLNTKIIILSLKISKTV